jgi:hypothetical protein
MARSKLGNATKSDPAAVPDARRDLHLANLAKLARAEVDRAIETGASIPNDEQRAELAAILARW